MTLPTDVGGVHVRVYGLSSSAIVSVVPEWSAMTVQDERNQPGQLSLTVARSAPGVAALLSLPSALLDVWEGANHVGWFLYDEDDGDDADAAGPDAPVTITAPGGLQMLEWVQIYPQDGFGTNAWQDYVQATPGAVLLDVLNRGKARGTLDGVNGPDVGVSFTADHDSDGTPWPTSVWVRYEAGKTMLDVVNDLCQRGYLDVRLTDTLDAYVANGSPDVSRSPIPATVSNDAQGWTAVSGCTATRVTTPLPTDVPGVTAVLQMLGQIPGVAPLQANVTTTQSALTTAQNKLNADTIAFNNAAAAAKRNLTATEKAALAADQKSLANAQKAYSAAVSALDAAQAATPGTDMTADTTATFAVTGGARYDASVEVHAEVVTRVCVFSLAFYDAGGQALGETVVGSTTDSPSTWGTIAGTLVAPPTATQARAVHRVVGAAQDEKHYAARPALSTSAGTTMTADLPGVVLLGPEYVQSGQRRRQRAPVRTALLGLGEGNLSLEAKDDDAIALYGRREGAASQGGISDYPTLQRLTQLALEQVKRPALGWTVSYQRVTGDPDVPVPQPWRDYRVGNTIRCGWLRYPDVDPLSTSVALAPVRVSSVTAAYDPGGMHAATVELGDIFEDRDVQIARQIQGLLLGASSANPLGAGSATGPDTVAPAAVGAVFIGSSVYLHPDGTYEALATIDWPAVTANEDGTAYDDPGYYQADYRIGDFTDDTSGWQGGLTTQDTGIGVGHLTPQTTMQARVLVVDASGNYPKLADGTPHYAYSAPTQLVADDVGPGAPDAPTVVAVPGGLSVAWNGLDNAGVAMPPDYTHVEVHVSTVTAFTPTTATLADTIVNRDGIGASSVLTPPLLTYGVDYYVRLVAYDSAGNASQPGVQTGPRRMQLIGPPDLDPTALTNTDHSAMLLPDVDFTTGGIVVADAAARDGNARQIPNNASLGGVAYTKLKPGRYRATFVIRTDQPSASPATTLGTCDVTGTAVTSDGARTITTADVSSAQGYRTVSVRFTVTAAANSVAPTVTCAIGHIWLSHCYVEPVMSIAVAEIRDVMVADLSATKLTAGSLTADVIAAQNASGQPGRIRVGIVNPATGQPSNAGVSLGSDGLYAQAAGGARTLTVDTATGNVTISGSFTAGSQFPSSVYGYNLVQNASMEDLGPGLSANADGTLPTGWLNNFATYSGGTAFADRSTVLGGAQSLTVAGTAAGKVVASAAFPVQPGERLQVVGQFRAASGATYVGLAFGTSNTFGTASATTPAVPANCVLLNLDGSVNATSTGTAQAGIAWVVANTTALGVSLKATGSVIVPAGHTWCRLVLGSTNGSVTYDNVGAVRTPDGTTISSATITGPTIQTATAGVRAEMTGPATPSSFIGPQLNFYQVPAAMPPARLYTVDASQAQYGGVSFPNLRVAVPAGGPVTSHLDVEMDPNTFFVYLTSSGNAQICYLAVNNDGSIDLNSNDMQLLVRPGRISLQDSSALHNYVLATRSGVDPIVQFCNPSSIGAMMSVRYFSTGSLGGILGGPGSNLGLQLYNVNASEVKVTNGTFLSFGAIRASAFNVGSTVVMKRDVGDLPPRYALDAVRFAPARTWRYVKPRGRAGAAQPTGSDDRALHVFPVLEDLPSEVWVDEEGIDLRDTVGLLWQAVRELADENDALRERVDAAAPAGRR